MNTSFHCYCLQIVPKYAQPSSIEVDDLFLNHVIPRSSEGNIENFRPILKSQESFDRCSFKKFCPLLTLIHYYTQYQNDACNEHYTATMGGRVMGSIMGGITPRQML